MNANMCMQVCAHMWRRERPLDFLLYHFLFSPLRHDISLNLEFGSQLASVILLFLPPLHWGYRHMCNHAKLFTWELITQTQILMLGQKILLPTEPSTRAQKSTFICINSSMGFRDQCCFLYRKQYGRIDAMNICSQI